VARRRNDDQPSLESWWSDPDPVAAARVARVDPTPPVDDVQGVVDVAPQEAETVGEGQLETLFPVETPPEPSRRRTAARSPRTPSAQPVFPVETAAQPAGDDQVPAAGVDAAPLSAQVVLEAAAAVEEALRSTSPYFAHGQLDRALAPTVERLKRLHEVNPTMFAAWADAMGVPADTATATVDAFQDEVRSVLTALSERRGAEEARVLQPSAPAALGSPLAQLVHDRILGRVSATDTATSRVSTGNTRSEATPSMRDEVANDVVVESAPSHVSSGNTAPAPVSMTQPSELPPTVSTGNTVGEVFRPSGQEALAPSGARARFRANLAALQTLRAVQAAGRPATPAEQAVLARWGGWGAQGLWQVLDEERPEFAEDRAQLRQLLSPGEYEAAQRTMLNAHYTDAAVVQVMWEAMERLGFAGGRVLEPGCGAGTFIGTAPTSASMVGVELDPTTAAIAALLYPNAAIRAESFADTRFPTAHFDAAIGNVPFSEVVLHDPRYNSAGLAMHNHFIVKSLEFVRPGGVVAALTSRYTMDATNPAARRAIAAQADLVAAVRLPTGTHRRAAGTEAVTDLLILRRRDPAVDPLRDLSWVDTETAQLPGPNGLEETRLNTYWGQHPDHVLGEQRIAVGMHGVAGVEVVGQPDQVASQLRQLLDAVTEQAVADGLGFAARTTAQEARAAGFVPASTDAIDGLILAHGDGSFSVVRDGAQEPLTVPRTQQAEVRALIGMRDEFRALVTAEAADLDDSPTLEAARQQLAAHWESYVATYGPISRITTRDTGRVDEDGEPIQARVMPAATRLFRTDPFGPLLWGLEVYDEATGVAEPAAILRQRMVVPRQPVLGVDNALDGLAVVLDTHGRVDIDEIARLQGVTVEQTLADLGDAVYQDPAAGEWQTRAAYCSGDVRSKLDAARQAAVDDPDRWGRNVAALEAVMPVDLQTGDITPRIGAAWIPDSDHEQFLRELTSDWRATVVRVPGAGWAVESMRHGPRVTQEWGTDRMPAGMILEYLARQKPIVITDPVEPGSSQRILNPTATADAIEKGRLMQERFAHWLWEDPDRTHRLLTEYNRRFNSLVLRDYSAEGDALTFPGLVKSFTPHPHQRAAVARILNEPSVGLFHAVGAGKTAEMVIGASELKRLGLVSKPAVVVPNHMLEQFAREWLQLYPQARILAAGSDDLAKDARRRFVAKAAANDWDGIILTRTAFQNLALTPANEQAFRDRQLADLREHLVAARKGNMSSKSLKAIERKMLADEEKLAKARSGPVDPALHWEATGIDYLFIDELHQYKNLATVSEIPDANIAGSKRALDLYAKLEYLRQSQGSERVATGATATPIANSVTEMHVMQRFLDPEGLERAGVTDFDAWAATFGEVVMGWESAVEGGNRFKLKSRFARFNNVPELRAMFARFADVKTTADLKLPIPAIAERPDGRRAPRLLVVPPSPELTAYIKEAGERADRISSRLVRPEEDNMLKLSGDGRRAALDMRLVDPHHSYSGGKIDVAADELCRVWQATKDNTYLDPATKEPSPIPGALQIVFCDLGTPKETWNVYDELKAQLVARGMPAERIRFVHEATNDHAKARLFAACRSGHVSVLIGSTERMGVGTNIQTRAYHLMDLDVPWRPADVEQRHGRILRQGNQHTEVLVTQLVAEGSFDQYMWQTLERKATFIEQILVGGTDARSTEGDVGEIQMNARETKAVASGNPLLLEFAQAQNTLDNLSRLERAHSQSQRSLAQQKSRAERELAQARTDLPLVVAAAAATTPTVGDAFSLDIRGRGRSTDRVAAATMLQGALPQLYGYRTETDPKEVAVLGGHTLTAAVSRDYNTREGQIRWTIVGVPGVGTTTIQTQNRDLVDLGVIRRLEHLVANSIPERIGRLQTTIAEAERTITQCDSLIGKPFGRADDLAAAREKFEWVSALMANVTERQATITEPTTEQAADGLRTLDQSTLSPTATPQAIARVEEAKDDLTPHLANTPPTAPGQPYSPSQGPDDPTTDPDDPDAPTATSQPTPEPDRPARPGQALAEPTSPEPRPRLRAGELRARISGEQPTPNESPMGRLRRLANDSEGHVTISVVTPPPPPPEQPTRKA